MLELLFEIFRPVNLLPTILLIMVLAYWLLAITGLVGDGIFDADADVSVDGVEGAGHALGGFGKFLHVGDVPVMVIASLLVVFFWASSVITNHYFNPDMRLGVVAVMLVPNIIVSLLITKLALVPIVPIMRKVNPVDSVAADLVGRLAVVQTLELNDRFGQITIEHDGPPIILEARCRGAILRKGDVVEIVEVQPGGSVCLVRLPKERGVDHV